MSAQVSKQVEYLNKNEKQIRFEYFVGFTLLIYFALSSVGVAIINFSEIKKRDLKIFLEEKKLYKNSDNL